MQDYHFGRISPARLEDALAGSRAARLGIWAVIAWQIYAHSAGSLPTLFVVVATVVFYEIAVILVAAADAKRLETREAAHAFRRRWTILTAQIFTVSFLVFGFWLQQPLLIVGGPLLGFIGFAAGMHGLDSLFGNKPYLDEDEPVLL